MKLGGKVFFPGTTDCMSDPELFGDKKNIALDSIGINSGNEIVNGDHYGASSHMNCQERNWDQLKYAVNGEDGWAASKLDCSMSVDDSTSNNEKEVRDFVPPMPLVHSSLKIESFEKEPVFYVDKSVTKSELPESVVCYKENTCHVVKDICIDEGVLFQDRFLFDIGASEGSLGAILPTEDINSEIVEERVDLDLCIQNIPKPFAEKEKSALCLPIPDVLISSEQKRSENEISLECESKGLMPIEEAKVSPMKEMVNVPFKEIFSLGELLSMPEVGTEISQAKSSQNKDDAEKQSIQRPSDNKIIRMASAREESESASLAVHMAEELYYGHQAVSGTLALENRTDGLGNDSSDKKMASHCGDFVPKSTRDHDGGSVAESTSKIGDESSYKNRVETKSTPFNCYFSAPTASGEEDFQNGGSEHSETFSSKLEVTNIEPFSSQHQYSFGETSFSSGGSLLGLLSYSGPIANSGSVSLRSDSSTTSTCSFAFPILQSEWNSSPVRMAKSGRKHRSWRQGLLCCRF